MVKTRAQKTMDTREILDAIAALGNKITEVQTDTTRQVAEIRTETAASVAEIRQLVLENGTAERERDTDRARSAGSPGLGENQSYDIRSSAQLPKFDGVNAEVHPSYFLEELDAHFAMYGVPERLQCRIANGLLRGSAKSWADVFLDGGNTFKEFKNEFISEFWGVAQQREVLHALYQEKCPKSKEGHMAEYFMGWVAKARRLTPKMNDADIVAAINTHFRPSMVKLLLAANSDSVSGSIILLKKYDAIHKLESQAEAKTWTQNRGGIPFHTQKTITNGRGEPSWRTEQAPRQNLNNNNRQMNNRRVNSVNVEGGEPEFHDDEEQGNGHEGTYQVPKNPHYQNDGTINKSMTGEQMTQ